MNRAGLRRWLDVAVLSIVGAAVGCFILIWEQALCRIATRLTTSFPGWWPSILIIAGAVAVADVCHRTSPFSARQVRFFLRYPPTWFAIIAALAATWFLHFAMAPVDRRFPHTVWLLGAGVLIVGCAINAGVRLTTNFNVGCSKTQASSNRPSGESFTSIADDWQKLVAWSANDQPIENRSQDLLGRGAVVHSIVSQLQRPFNESVAVGLVGNFGSGKTSVIKLIKEEIDAPGRRRSNPNVLFCPIDCWGFESSEAALRNILTRVVDTLSTRADCLAIRQFPETYRKLLSGGGGWWASLASVVGDSNPNSQLERLIPILTAINTRLVLVVEELDRPQSSHFDQADIVATLCHLKSIRGMSYILVGNNELKSRIPFMKLCDHSEELRMDTESIFQAIVTTRRALLTKYGDLDPMPDEKRQQIDRSLCGGHAVDRYVQLSWFGKDDSFATAIARLVTTPRVLKHIVRNMQIRWESLHGEVDFDDLLVHTILHFTAEASLDFARQQINILQMGAEDRGAATEAAKEAMKRRTQTIQADWEKTIEKVGWDAVAARTLILYLFPKAAEYFGKRNSVERIAPQGVKHSEPTNYWRRISTGELDPSEPRDQDVLKAMSQWPQSPLTSTVASQLCSSAAFVKRWEHFAEYQPVPGLLGLASQVFEIIRRRDGSRAAGDRQDDGVMALWRVAHRTTDRTEKNSEWLCEEMLRSVPVSLRFANSLYYFWGSVFYGIIGSEEKRNEVRQRFVATVRAAWTTEGAESLVRVLDPTYPYSVHQLIAPSDDKEPKSILASPPDWTWLTPILLLAASRWPSQIVPEIVSLVARSNPHSNGELVTTWNEDVRDTLFAGNVRTLMATLVADFDVGALPLDASVKLTIQNTRSLARQWLDEDSEAGSKRAGTPGGIVAAVE